MPGTPCKDAALLWERIYLKPRAECRECPWVSPPGADRATDQAKQHAAVEGHYVFVIAETRAFYAPRDWQPPTEQDADDE